MLFIETCFVEFTFLANIWIISVIIEKRPLCFVQSPSVKNNHLSNWILKLVVHEVLHPFTSFLYDSVHGLRDSDGIYM